MKRDTERIKNYLLDIKSRALEIEKVLKEFSNEDILTQVWLIRGLKYLLIEIAEIMANALTHIHAKDKGESVIGYVETVIKAGEIGVISQALSNKLKPFFDFRNSLVHRYWIISDEKLLTLARENYRDFFNFIEEIEDYLKTTKS